MDHEAIHYVPVVEQRYAEIIQDLEEHPARNQWSRGDRKRLSAKLIHLATSGPEAGPGATLIPMAVDRVRDVAGWIQDAPGFSPAGLVDLLKSYVQPGSK